MPEGKIRMKTPKETLHAKHHIFFHSDHRPNTVISKNYIKEMYLVMHMPQRDPTVSQGNTPNSLFLIFCISASETLFATQNTKKHKR